MYHPRRHQRVPLFSNGVSAGAIVTMFAVCLLISTHLCSVDAVWSEVPVGSVDELVEGFLRPGGGLQLVDGTSELTGQHASPVVKFANGPNGMESGVLLQSSDDGPVDPSTGSPLCSQVLQADTVGAAVLSFNFSLQPSARTLTFEYVFATVENIDTPDPQFNDVLAVYVDGVLVASMTVLEAAQLNMTKDSDFPDNDNPRRFAAYSPTQQTTFAVSAGTHNMQLAVCNAGDGTAKSGGFFARLRVSAVDDDLARRLIVPYTGLELVPGSASTQERGGTSVQPFSNGPSGIGNGVLLKTNSDPRGDDPGTGSLLCSEAIGRPVEDTFAAGILSFNLTVDAGAEQLSLDYVFATNETQDSQPEFDDVIAVYIDGNLVFKLSFNDLNNDSLSENPGGFADGHGFARFTELKNIKTVVTVGNHYVQLAACNVGDGTVSSGGFFARLKGTYAVEPSADELAERLIVPNTGLQLVAGSASKEKSGGSELTPFTKGPKGIGGGILLATNNNLPGDNAGTGSELCAEALGHPLEDTYTASVLTFNLTVGAGAEQLSIDYVFGSNEGVGSLPKYNDVVAMYLDGVLAAKLSISDIDFNSIQPEPDTGAGLFGWFTELRSIQATVGEGNHLVQLAACNVGDDGVSTGAFFASLRGSATPNVCGGDCIVKAVKSDVTYAEVQSSTGKCVYFDFTD